MPALLGVLGTILEKAHEHVDDPFLALEEGRIGRLLESRHAKL